MKTTLLYFATLITLSNLAWAHEGDDHSVGKTAAPTGAGYFSAFASSPLFEVFIRYEPLVPREAAHLTLFLSDFATNVPIKGAKLTLTCPEDSSIKFEVLEQSPGMYLIETSFPAKQTYSLTVKVVAGSVADLLLVKNIEAGKELATIEGSSSGPFFTWQMIILLLGVFMAGLGTAYLMLRKRIGNQHSQPNVAQ
jgi:hypothetical protein